MAQMPLAKRSDVVKTIPPIDFANQAGQAGNLLEIIQSAATQDPDAGLVDLDYGRMARRPSRRQPTKRKITTASAGDSTDPMPGCS
jgi:hypothetical protein